MIDRAHKLSVARQVKLLGFSRGSVYYLPRPVPDGDLALMRRIDELHLDYPFAGSRMLQGLLRGEWLQTGRLHVATLMKKMGIEAIYRGPNTSKPAPGQKSILPLAQASGHPTQPGVGDGLDLHPHGSRICLPLRRRGLVQPEGSVDHDGSSLLHRSSRGSAGPLWHSIRTRDRSSPRWTARVRGGTTSSSNGSGVRSNTRKSTSTPTKQYPRPASASADI